jgi:uncharacterized protein YciI
MYIINLTYLKPLADIEIHLEAHRSFLDQQYATQVFLASGPKNPRDGGVILASGRVTREELDALINQDPFRKNGIADYAVIEFSPTKYHQALAAIL